MGMTIEEVLKIIKDGRIVATIIKGNNEDDTKFNQENIEALNTIIVTMHKYQKIKNIINAPIGGTSAKYNAIVNLIKYNKVLKNGNDN